MNKRIIVIVVLASLVVASFGFLFFTGKGSHRARFVLAMNELRQANADLQKHGASTNRLQGDTVYPYTNRFTIDGTVYQCGLAVESVDLYLRDRGILAITTNGGFVWVDKERGAMPLGSGPAFTFPPGFWNARPCAQQTGSTERQTNFVSVGEWSKPVSDYHGYTLRGRLLLCQVPWRGSVSTPDIGVYLELEEVSDSAVPPVEVFCDLSATSRTDGLHLQGVEFDFRRNKLEFRLLNDVERPRLLRVLSFERVRNLHIEPNDLEDIDPDCLDGIIGIHRQEDVFCIHTDSYEICFRSGALSIDERNA